MAKDGCFAEAVARFYKASFPFFLRLSVAQAVHLWDCWPDEGPEEQGFLRGQTASPGLSDSPPSPLPSYKSAPTAS